VTSIGIYAFAYCRGLSDIVFGGDAPTVGSSAFSFVADGCTATVYADTAGWDDDGDGKWNWLTLVYRERGADPIPDIGENPTAEEIAEALGGSADSTLADHVTNGTQYAAYRAWAQKVKGADVQAVKESPNAWLSFALGSETLIANAPTNGAVKIESFEPAADGTFAFTVSVKDIKIGSAAAAENLKQVFGLEGGASLEEMSPGGVDIVFGTPENGKVTFSAKPKDADLSAYFMKVRMTP